MEGLLTDSIGDDDGAPVRNLAAQFSSADRSTRSAILDQVALRAATGSVPYLELLLKLIDEHALDRPSIRRILIDDRDAEDAHQDVLIGVSRSVSGFRGDAAFSTWLHAIARNCAVDTLRRRRDTDPLADDGEWSAFGARLSSMVSNRTDLRRAVEALPEPYRAALVLRDIEQRTYQDVAEVLGASLNTVKSRIHRGRALLAAALSDADFDGIVADG